MKNINIKKRLALKADTLRSLANQQLRQVGGGIGAALYYETMAPYCRRPTLPPTGTACEA